MRAREHCQFGSSAKRALAILVARNSNWHILRQVSVSTGIVCTTRAPQAVGNILFARLWLQDVIDVPPLISDCAVLLLVAGDTVLQILLYDFAN